MQQLILGMLIDLILQLRDFQSLNRSTLKAKLSDHGESFSSTAKIISTLPQCLPMTSKLGSLVTYREGHYERKRDLPIKSHNPLNTWPHDNEKYQISTVTMICWCGDMLLRAPIHRVT